jgi:UDP-N-acetyl-D-galactosamine dehydrogenase
VDIVTTLAQFGISVQVYDPLAAPPDARREYGIKLVDAAALVPADAVIFAVAHREFVQGGWPFVAGLLKGGTGVVLDIKGRLDRTQKPEGIELWRL